MRVRLALDDGGDVAVTVVVPDAAGHALPHIHALHGHAAGCAGRPDVHVDLLLRCCRAMGGVAERLIVRGGAAPAFWLEVRTGAGDRAHLDLGVLDAVVLLASRRLPVAVDLPHRPAPDWDAALRRLLEHG